MKTKEEIAQYKKEYAQKHKEKIKEQQAEYYQEHKETIKKCSNERYSEFKDDIVVQRKKHYQENKERIDKTNREYIIKNKEEVAAYLKEYRKWKKNGLEKDFAKYYQENKIKIIDEYKEYKKKLIILSPSERKLKRKIWVKIYNSKYRKKRKSIDILFKLTIRTRCSITGCLKRGGYSKKSKTEKILGCSFNEFKLHLESKFEPWMNWSNYGNWNGQPKEINVAWDIDHITPLSSATTEEEIIRLNHYTNLQPLCSYVNRYVKSGKIST